MNELINKASTQDFDLTPYTGGSANGAQARQKLMDAGFTADEAEYLTGLITEDELLAAQVKPSPALNELINKADRHAAA